MLTYGDIYREFRDTGHLQDMVTDYRPCCEMFDVPNIDNAIVIWLKNGSKLIYIAKETE